MPKDSVAAVIEANTGWFMSLGGVIGVGQGRCDETDCMVVFVESMTPDVSSLPDTLEGFPIRIEVTGQVTAPPE